LGSHGHFACSRTKQGALHSNPVTEVEQLAYFVLDLAEFVAPQVDLQSSGPVCEVCECALSHVAQRHQPTGDPYRRCLFLVAKQVESRTEIVGGVVRVGVRVHPEIAKTLELDVTIPDRLGSGLRLVPLVDGKSVAQPDLVRAHRVVDPFRLRKASMNG
jgi:hypothetical protein